MACAAPAQAQLASLNFKGFNYVSYYNGGYANADSMPALVTTGANAVALAFEYGIDVDNSTVYADSNYTEASSVIASTIAEANSRGLNVMVRPLIDFLAPSKIGSYSVGDWRSTYNPTNVATFFASYKSMIVSVAQLAQANGAASWRAPITVLFKAQTFLNLLQRDSFGFGHHELHPEQLQHHHAAEEREDITGREGRDHFGEKGGE